MISSDFRKGLQNLIKQLESEVIDCWQPKVEVIKELPLEPAAPSGQFKFLFAQSHELLYILQKTQKEIDPKSNPTFKHTNSLEQEVKKEKPKQNALL
jgi:hypothetical protein